MRLDSRRLRALVAVATGCAALSSIAAPAWSDTQGGWDAIGDVERQSRGLGDEGPPPDRDTANAVDVVSYTNDYSDGFLTLSTTVRRRNDFVGFGWAVTWAVKSPRHSYFLQVHSYRDLPSGYLPYYTDDRGKIDCTRDAQVTVVGNTITYRIPARCVRDAGALRIANVTVVNVARDATMDTYFDDANSMGGSIIGTYARRLRYSSTG